MLRRLEHLVKENGRLAPLLAWLFKHVYKNAQLNTFQSSCLILAICQDVGWLQALWKQHQTPCNFKNLLSACLYMKAIFNTEGFIKGSKATGRSIFSVLLRISDLLTCGDLAVIFICRSVSLTYLTDLSSFLLPSQVAWPTSQNFSVTSFMPKYFFWRLCLFHISKI